MRENQRSESSAAHHVHSDTCDYIVLLENGSIDSESNKIERQTGSIFIKNRRSKSRAAERWVIGESAVDMKQTYNTRRRTVNHRADMTTDWVGS